jgi:transposase
MTIITVGIDLAKNVFAVHGVDDNGKAVLVKPKVARDKLAELIARPPPCVVGMEACSGAPHWARQFRPYGHTREADGAQVRHALTRLGVIAPGAWPAAPRLLQR